MENIHIDLNCNNYIGSDNVVQQKERNDNGKIMGSDVNLYVLIS